LGAPAAAYPEGHAAGAENQGEGERCENQAGERTIYCDHFVIRCTLAQVV
jgi:hypothetical protein